MSDHNSEQFIQTLDFYIRWYNEKPIKIFEHSIHYTISAGVAGMDAGVADVNALLHRADTAMYAAKESGRNSIRCWVSGSRNSG